MRPKSKSLSKSYRWGATFLGLLLVLHASGIVLRLFYNFSTGDPDRYFHLAFARQVATEWLPEAISQADNIQWRQQYPGHYFLFSTFGGISYRLFGEQGMIWGVRLFTLAFCAFLYAILLRHLTPLKAALLFIAAILLTPDFGNRLSLLRPHLFALFLFTVLCCAIASRRYRVAYVACLLFSLTYYILQIPLVAIVIAIVAGWGEGKTWHRAWFAALLGLISGLLIHPYFPLPLYSFLNSLGIVARVPAVAPHDLSSEMLPHAANSFFSRYAVHGALLLMAGVVWRKHFVVLWPLKKHWRAPWRLSGEGAELRFLLLTALALWLFMAHVPRTIEYAWPLLLIVTARALPAVPPALMWSVGPVSLAATLVVVFPFYRALKNHKGSHHDWVRAVVEKLPENAPGKVFHCVWSDSPFILYARPQLKFVDILEPSLLAKDAPRLSQLRTDFRLGGVLFPFGMLRQAFQSDYVLCGDPAVREQLDRDPHFTKISATGEGEQIAALYRLVPKRFPALVSEYELVSQWPRHLAEWRLAKHRHQQLVLPYVDFNRLDSGLVPAATVDTIGKRCAKIRPTARERERLKSAAWVGVGGGPRLTLRVGKREWFRADEGGKRMRWNRYLVQLPAALRDIPVIELEACETQEQTHWVGALSFWQDHEVKRLCGAGQPFRAPSARIELADSCLGTVVRVE